mmetsp:Transcript_13393/g.35737  ORF Transcript_13393/g.35737 Transcript_13393/m.35737 type:complete len:232 (-) Transcript_13393:31-726(-)
MHLVDGLPSLSVEKALARELQLAVLVLTRDDLELVLAPKLKEAGQIVHLHHARLSGGQQGGGLGANVHEGTRGLEENHPARAVVTLAEALGEPAEGILKLVVAKHGLVILDDGEDLGVLVRIPLTHGLDAVEGHLELHGVEYRVVHLVGHIHEALHAVRHHRPIGNRRHTCCAGCAGPRHSLVVYARAAHDTGHAVRPERECAIKGKDGQGNRCVASHPQPPVPAKLAART